MIITKNIINNYINESIRDVTSFGNLVILTIIALVSLSGNGLIVALLSLFLAEITCSLVKLTLYKERPVPQKFNNTLEKINASSFPSIHAARVSTVFLPIAYYSKNTTIIAVSILIIIAVSVSRVLLKKHYWTDVIAGLFIATMISLTLIKLIG